MSVSSMQSGWRVAGGEKRATPTAIPQAPLASVGGDPSRKAAPVAGTAPSAPRAPPTSLAPAAVPAPKQREPTLFENRGNLSVPLKAQIASLTKAINAMKKACREIEADKKFGTEPYGNIVERMIPEHISEYVDALANAQTLAASVGKCKALKPVAHVSFC